MQLKSAEELVSIKENSGMENQCSKIGRALQRHTVVAKRSSLFFNIKKQYKRYYNKQSKL